MNVEDVKKALKLFDPITAEQELAKETLRVFIEEVEQLLAKNSIKQTPALFRPFERS